MINLRCNRCQNIWKYKGSNKYCANCSRCKSTVFINRSSILLPNKTDQSNSLIDNKPKVTENKQPILKDGF